MTNMKLLGGGGSETIAEDISPAEFLNNILDSAGNVYRDEIKSLEKKLTSNNLQHFLFNASMGLYLVNHLLLGEPIVVNLDGDKMAFLSDSLAALSAAMELMFILPAKIELESKLAELREKLGMLKREDNSKK